MDATMRSKWEIHWQAILKHQGARQPASILCSGFGFRDMVRQGHNINLGERLVFDVQRVLVSGPRLLAVLRPMPNGPFQGPVLAFLLCDFLQIGKPV
jgi:hypothetical protein